MLRILRIRSASRNPLLGKGIDGFTARSAPPALACSHMRGAG
jgi:hypothetical protein